jgi:hypothetical protein
MTWSGRIIFMTQLVVQFARSVDSCPGPFITGNAELGKENDAYIVQNFPALVYTEFP